MSPHIRRRLCPPFKRDENTVVRQAVVEHGRQKESISGCLWKKGHVQDPVIYFEVRNPNLLTHLLYKHINHDSIDSDLHNSAKTELRMSSLQTGYYSSVIVRSTKFQENNDLQGILEICQSQSQSYLAIDGQSASLSWY
jgi:hypothetical protein